MTPKITVQKNVVPKNIKIGFIVETTETPPIINYIEQFVKLTGHTYACNSLTNFRLKCMQWPETEITRNLNKLVEFECKNYCQEKCRPKNHKDWVYCWNNRKTSKNYIEQFVKFTGHTYACNSLTNFAYEVYAMTGNGNYAKSEQVSWIWLQQLLSRKISSQKS